MLCLILLSTKHRLRTCPAGAAKGPGDRRRGAAKGAGGRAAREEGGRKSSKTPPKDPGLQGKEGAQANLVSFRALSTKNAPGGEDDRLY